MNINLFSQNVGIINIDSVATYSVIEDSSFIFCNQIRDSYIKEGRRLTDSLNFKYKIALKEIQTIDASAEYFAKKEKELDDLYEDIVRLEREYYNIQHVLNKAIYNFTVQEILRSHNVIKAQLKLNFLITAPPIYVDFNQSNVKIINVTQEVINIMNNSTSFRENWLLFKNQIKLPE